MLQRLFNRISYHDYLQKIVRRPVVVLLFFLIVTLIFIALIPRLSFKTSIYDLEIEDLPETVNYESFKGLFGSDEIIRLVIKADDVFDPITFGKISEIANTVSKIDGVRRVISLPSIKQAVDLSGNWSLEKFYTVIAPVDLFTKYIITNERKATALTLVLETDADPELVIRGVEQVLAEAPEGLSLYQVGMPLVSQALMKFTANDFFILPPITFILIATILLLIFRKIHLVLIPLVCVSLGLIWTFGLMALINIPLSMLTMIVPVFLIAVGTAYCLHIVTEYIACLQHADSPESASISTFSNIYFPTLLAVITTIFGLGSLLVNRIPAIREFALFSCFGMFSLLVITLIFLPAALTFLPIPAQKQTARIGSHKVFDRFIEKIIDINLNKQKIVLPILAGIVAFCAFGMLRIKVETNPVGYFKEDTPVIRHFHDIYRDLSGSFPINVTVQSKDDYYFENPQNIAQIEDLQKFLETLPGVDKSISFADYMKLVNYALNGFDPKFYALPSEGFEARMAINNYATMLGEDMFTSFMNQNLSHANIVLLTHLSSSREFLETRDKIIEFAEESLPQDLILDTTGFGIVISASSHQLTNGQIKSLSLTMILVFAIMFTLFLSFKVGLIAIVPNMFPIVINFGIMGWLGIELSMVTSLIASIAIGLAVDDTIHYLFRYNREFKEDLDRNRALAETLRKVGRPIVFTTVTICIGFSNLIISNFKPTAVFGIMMVITMLSALVGDLILLPSLMQHVELVTLWDLVRLKLGQEPAKGIPLFKDLSRTEIHYLIMAGSLQKIEAGEILFRKGDPSNSMYTIISGTMDVLDSVNDEAVCPGPTSERLINRMKAGDVLGEMGLLRSAPRSATVTACEPVELLPINWAMIKRLQWLYPPTARKFMYNLLTILCGRVERLTTCLAEVKILDDATGLSNRENFIKLLDGEIQRSICYQNNLSLCLMAVEFQNADKELDLWQQERILQSVSETLVHTVRDFDVLGRCDRQLFGLFFPQTSQTEAREICYRLQDLLQNKSYGIDGLRLKISFGLTVIGVDTKETASGWIQKTTDLIEETENL
jgi:diguanylate cyclase (GGDEF)-like protein